MEHVIARGRRVAAITIVVSLLIAPVVGVAIQPVAAQDGNGGKNNGGKKGSNSPTSFAKNICTSGGYSMVLGIAYVIVALVFISLIVGAAMGAGLISLGWLGRTFSEKAKKMFTGSISGGILFLLTLTIISIAIANAPISLPSSCTWLFA